MKLVHLSDLHLGKRVNEFSMIEDQKYILTKIINIIDEENPDGVLIAGDVYDRSVPSEEAMILWDDFLNRISARKIPVFAISGNHDSAIRLAEHGKLIENAGIYLSPAYDGMVQPITMDDENGKMNIYMLPYIKPVTVKQYFPDEKIEDYTDACRVAINHMEVNTAERNVLIAHQFVLGASICDSEEHSIGGLDSVSASVFDDFDYVALGHLHGKQYIGRETVRYSGTPLKYSFSEKNHHKSVTIVDLGQKGDVQIREVPLIANRDLREIKGTYDEVTNKKNYEGTAVDDYIHVILTDEEDIPDAIGKLRVIYKNIMKLSYDNKRTRENKVISGVEDVEKKSQIELFDEFYEKQNNQKMSDEQRKYTQELIDSIWRA